MKKEQLRREGFQFAAGIDHVRCRGEVGDGLQGERERDSLMVRHSEQGNSVEVLQGLVKTRSSWFPARWMGGEGEESEVKCGEEVDELR